MKPRSLWVPHHAAHPRRVAEALAEAPGTSAAELARRLQMSRWRVAAILAELVETGRARCQIRRDHLHTLTYTPVERGEKWKP
jgi:DNA-binding IclR family transcriptional regulator